MSPNILFIQTDQHRPDIMGCSGHPLIETPNLDALAARGQRFTNAFCCTAVCTPSRGAVLSGMWPHRSGMIFNPEMGASFGHRLCDYDKEITPFSHVLRDMGYAVSNSGKWHVGPRNSERGESAYYGIEGVHFEGYGYPADHEDYDAYLKKHGYDGFDTHPPKGGALTTTGEEPPKNAIKGSAGTGYMSEHRVSAEASVPGYLCSMAIEQLQDYKEKDTPFFHSINFWGPHVPVNIPPEYLYRYDPNDVPLSENNRNIIDNRAAIHGIAHLMWGGKNLSEDNQRRIISAYYGYVHLIDEQLGRVFDYLENSGLADNTIVIFSSDHGTTLGAHGLQDKGLNVYDEVYRIPLIIAGPGISAGKVREDFISNIDLTPSFVEMAGAEIPESYDGQSFVPLLKDDSSYNAREEIIGEAFGHQMWYPQRFIRDHKFKYIFNAVDNDEFYDLERDPHEQHNLIDMVNPDLLKNYRKKLLAWAQKTNDRQCLFLRQTKMKNDEMLEITE